MIIDKSIQGPSKILTRKWKNQEMEIHKAKIASVQSIVGTNPTSYRHTNINKKKNEQLLEEKYTEIERENRILFEKIQKINDKGNAPVNITTSTNSNSFLMPNTTTYRKISPPNIVDFKERMRQNEQSRLFKENMKFLQRLRNSKGTLDGSKFQEFEKQHNTYLKNISETPLQFAQPRSSSVIKQKEQFSNLQMHQNYMTGMNHNYQQPTSTASTSRYQINKDFTSGLKLPQTRAQHINDSFDNSSTTPGNMNYSSISKEGELIDQPMKKRFKTRPKKRKRQNNSLPPDSISQLHDNNESNFLEEKILYSTRVMDQENLIRLNVDISRKEKKIYIRASNKRLDIKSQTELHLKQATQMLMMLNNDFDLFVKECLTFKNRGIQVKDINKIKYSSIQYVADNDHEITKIKPMKSANYNKPEHENVSIYRKVISQDSINKSFQNNAYQHRESRLSKGSINDKDITEKQQFQLSDDGENANDQQVHDFAQL